jgi:type I restriction enzyme, S subunit
MTQQTQNKINWKEKPLEEVLDYEQPVNYIINTGIKKEGKIPVLTPGKSFIKGYTDETEGIYKNLPIVLFDDFTTSSKFVNFPFKVKSSALKILKPKTASANLKFIYYQMQTKNVNFTTHKRYYLSQYQKLNFLFPIKEDNSLDFETQSKIVSAIETQFSRLDETIENLKAVKKKIGTYRKSVLKKAFEKKKGWEEKKLGELSKIKGGKRIPKGMKLSDKKTLYPYIRVTDFDNYSINLSSLKHIGKEIQEKISNYTISTKDIYISIAGTIGKVGRIPIELEGANLTENSAKITQIKEINSKYLMYYLDSPYIKQKIKFAIKSTNQPKLALFRIAGFDIPFPKPLSEQSQIVQEIESKFSVIDKLEQVIEQSLKKAERLRKSILKVAFEGRLIKN